MFCQNCGFNLDDNAAFCPNCGNAVAKADASIYTSTAPVATPAPEQTYAAPQQNYTTPQPVYNVPQPTYNAPQPTFLNPITARFNTAFSNALFLVVCILVTVSTVFSSFTPTDTSQSFSPDVLGILFSIFLWITFVSAKKGNVSVKSLRSTSGIVLAMYILMWVVIGLFVIAGAIFLVIGNDAGKFLEAVMVELPYETRYEIANIISELGISSIDDILVFFAIVAFVSAGIATVLNILFYGSLRKFAKTLYTSALNGADSIKKASVCSIWLLIVGIFTALTIFNSSGAEIIAKISQSATYIILFIWIRKFFVAATPTFTAPQQNYIG